jgi:hypothetical protein
MTSATAAKTSEFQSLSQKVILAIEAPPSLAARYCSAVASGPYTLTWCCHLRGTDIPKLVRRWRRYTGAVT